MKPSKRTIITLNRFITSIQNWRVKAVFGLVGISIFVVLSCKDDDSQLGFPKDPRLNSTFVEIPLTTSVLRRNGVITQSFISDANNRIMVGQYNDPELGLIEARAFASITPPPSLPTRKQVSLSVFDSLILELRLDFYHYGSPDSSGQHIQVFEPVDTLNDLKTIYTNDVNVALLPALMGEATFGVDPADFEILEPYNTDSDSTNDKVLKVYIKIAGNMGPDLLEDLKNNRTIFSDPIAFYGKYHGFGIVSASGDKVLGLNPVHYPYFPYSTTKDSRLTLYYTDSVAVNKKTHFLLDNAFSSTFQKDYSTAHFTTLTVDRTGTPLAGIGDNTDFVPTNGKLYVQGGTSLITKLDFTNFFAYMDTVENAIFSSVELVVTNSSTLRPPGSMLLRVLDDNNAFRSASLDSAKVKLIYFPKLLDLTLKHATDPYFGTNSTAFSLPTSILGGVDVIYDVGTTNITLDATSGKIDQIFMTEFCQRLYYYKTHPRKATKFGLMTNDDDFRKSVSSLTLDSNVKLKIYYSKPVIKIQ